MKIKREITVNKSAERKWIDSSVRPGAPPAGFTQAGQSTPKPGPPPQSQSTPKPSGRSTRADAADK